MKIEQYIKLQQDLNHALRSPDQQHSDYALFKAIFTDEMELSREHIDENAESVESDVLKELIANARSATHTKANETDYECANRINQAMQNTQWETVKWLMVSSGCALSLHDNPKYIDDEILTNCSANTQAKIKQAMADESLFDVGASSNHYQDIQYKEQDTAMLADLIEDIQQLAL